MICDSIKIPIGDTFKLEKEKIIIFENIQTYNPENLQPIIISKIFNKKFHTSKYPTPFNVSYVNLKQTRMLLLELKYKNKCKI